MRGMKLFEFQLSHSIRFYEQPWSCEKSFYIGQLFSLLSQLLIGRFARDCAQLFLKFDVSSSFLFRFQ